MTDEYKNTPPTKPHPKKLANKPTLLDDKVVIHDVKISHQQAQ